jgi:hypothetical protein
MPNENKNWFDQASCLDYDPEIFFDLYEEDEGLRPITDSVCEQCPIARMCLAVGVTDKSTGVWGGVYLDRGKISKEFNSHKNKQDWARTWEYLTTDRE